MIPAGFRELVIQREPAWDSDGHATIVVRSAQPQAADGLDSLVPGFDTSDAGQWFELTAIAVDLAGILARLAVKVLPSIVLGPRGHQCDRAAQPRDELDPYEATPEIVTGTFGSGGCGVYLDGVRRGAILDDGRLPALELTVPANRARSWLVYLAELIEDLQMGDIEAQLNAPAIAAACQSTEGTPCEASKPATSSR